MSDASVWVYVCVSVRARVRVVCAHACVCVCVCVCECGVKRDHGQTGLTRQWLGSNQAKEHKWMYE